MKKFVLIVLSALLAVAVGVGGVFVYLNRDGFSLNSQKLNNTEDNCLFIEVGESLKIADGLADWESSAPEIISVTKNGKAKAHKAGYAVISSSKGVDYKAYAVERRGDNKFSSDNMTIVNTDSAEYTYDQMQADIEKLCDKYDYILTYSSIGKTYDNREIYEITVGNPNAEKQVLIQACMHSREYLNALLVMRQVESICANYCTASYNGSVYCEFFEKVCIHFMPMVNPDGVAVSQFGAEAIRNDTLRADLLEIKANNGSGEEFFKRWKANARGVDLNRNFPVNWDKYSTGSDIKGSKNYKGDSPASEKETQCLMTWIEQNNPDAIINYHSTGSVLYWNFLQEGKLQKQSESLFNMAHNLTHYNDAEPNLTKENQGWEPTFGAWTCEKMRIPTLTIETGTGECPLKISEFENIWNNQKYIPVAVAEWLLGNDNQ